MDKSNPSTTLNTTSPDRMQPAEPATILPRSAWSSELTKLRITLQAKRLLDRQDSAGPRQSHQSERFVDQS